MPHVQTIQWKPSDAQTTTSISVLNVDFCEESYLQMMYCELLHGNQGIDLGRV